MLDLVGLEGYEQRRVYELSGGEQQRVALARSLAPGPRLLMLDEPLGSLDRALREELMNELRSILKRVGVTAIYVTHDQQEAFAIADRVIIMDRGRIVQQGTPQAVYRHPASAWVARFLGLTNLVPGHIAALAPLEVDTPLGRLTLPQAEGSAIGQRSPCSSILKRHASMLIPLSQGSISSRSQYRSVPSGAATTAWPLTTRRASNWSLKWSPNQRSCPSPARRSPLPCAQRP